MQAGRFRAWFERYKIVATFRGLLQWIGVWGILMSLFFSVFAFLWLHFEHLTPPVRFIVALAAFVLVAGVVAAMSYLWRRKSVLPSTKHDRKIYDVYGSEYSSRSPKIRPTVGSLVTSASAVMVFIPIARYTGAIDHLAGMLKPLEETAVFMQCNLVGLPLTIHPQEHVEVIGINEKTMAQGLTWGGMEIHNESSKDTLWPSEVIDFRNPGTYGHKCTISNEGLSTVLYLQVPIDLWFNHQKTAIRYSPIVSSLKPSGTFAFYLFNDCNVHVAGIWQEVANARILGESKLRQIPLRRRYMSPTEQVMVFLPSTKNWTGMQPCN
jgi:hypothetical protein